MAMWNAIVLDDHRMETMKQLIASGHDVNKRDGNHRTPLDYCVSVHALDGIYNI